MTTAVMTCVISVIVTIAIFITFTHSISVHRKDLEAHVLGEIRKEKKMESRKKKRKEAIPEKICKRQESRGSER